MSRHTIDRYRFFALFGALAAAIGCLADVLLLYNPQGGYELGFDEVLRRINNPFRSMLGGLLGVFVLPFMLLGCWALRQVLATTHHKTANFVFATAVYTLCVGVAWHGMAGIAAPALNLESNGNNIAAAADFAQHVLFLLQPVGVVLVVLFGAISASMAAVIYGGKTPFSNKLAFINPFVIYILCFVAYVLHAKIGGALLVAGFNLSLFIWFLLTYQALQQSANSNG